MAFHKVWIFPLRVGFSAGKSVFESIIIVVGVSKFIITIPNKEEKIYKKQDKR